MGMKSKTHRTARGIDGLTDRQREVLQFINACSLPLTYRDVAIRFGISAKGAYDHIAALKRAGKIYTSPGIARSIRMPDTLIPKRFAAPGKTVQLNARITEKQAKQLAKYLKKRGSGFSQWLRTQIDKEVDSGKEKA